MRRRWGISAASASSGIGIDELMRVRDGDALRLGQEKIWVKEAQIKYAKTAISRLEMGRSCKTRVMSCVISQRT
jgi:hypothetical protein